MFIHFQKLRAADSGYLATVVLLVSSLAEDFGGLRRLADAFGLLDESKPRRWQLHDTERPPSAGSRGVICGQTPSTTTSLVKSFGLQSSMALIRCLALLTAAFFGCQYLVRYAPRQLREALAIPICRVPEDSRIRGSGRQDMVECHLFVLALCSAGHCLCS